MDWRRKRQIRNLVDGILELNTLHRPPIELIPAIMKQRGIIFEERDEDDEEFCGVYMVVKQAKSSLSTQIFEHPANTLPLPMSWAIIT